MTIIKHELRQNRTAFAVWTASIAFLLIVCVFLFPDVKGEMDSVGNLFASMGSFTAAFGMDRLNIGTLIGYYSIECGNILGLGGALFASLLGISALAKEERDRTAEFLLTHPVSRKCVITEKLAAVLLQITVMNLLILILSLLSVALIGEDIPLKSLLLIHGAYFLLQLELACICFGISAFLRRGGAGIGMGLAAAAYFLNLVANISESARFLHWLTPFAYCEGADIITGGKLDGSRIAVGMTLAIIGIITAFRHYIRKDIR